MRVWTARGNLLHISRRRIDKCGGWEGEVYFDGMDIRTVQRSYCFVDCLGLRKRKSRYQFPRYRRTNSPFVRDALFQYKH